MRATGLDSFLELEDKDLFENRPLTPRERGFLEIKVKMNCPQLKRNVPLEKCMVCRLRDRCWGVPLDFAYIHLLNSIEQQRISKENLRVSSISTCIYRQILQVERGIIEKPESMAPKIRGEIIHHGLIKLFNPEGGRYEYPAEYILGDIRIVGHVDIYNPNKREVIEVKVTRHTPKRRELKQYWLLQLALYMFLLKADIGKLVVVSRNLDGFAVYTVKPKSGFSEVIEELIERSVKGYERVISDGEIDYRQVGSIAKEICAKCPFRKSCPIKFKERPVRDIYGIVDVSI